MFSVLLMRALYSFESKLDFNRRGSIDGFGKKFNYDLQVFVSDTLPVQANFPDSQIQAITSNLYHDVKPAMLEIVEAALFGLAFNNLYYFTENVNGTDRYICLKVSLEEFSLFG